jgi:hypothetical protein
MTATPPHTPDDDWDDEPWPEDIAAYWAALNTSRPRHTEHALEQQ